MTTTEPLPTQPEEERRRRRRGLLLWGSVAAVGALVSSAAFVDAEWANLNGDGGYAVGEYNLQLSADGSTYSDYETAPGLEVTIDGATQLFPGSEPAVVGTYWVKNASDDADSTLALTMEQVAGETTDTALRDALVFTVQVGDEVLTEDSYAELAAGVDLEDLAVGEAREVTVTASLPDSLGDASGIEGTVAHLQIKLDGTSTDLATA
ncbi:hypothetical protein [Georgenia alba]|uniref:Alternate signal-mediated exported protein, RER_14450 family n=1 Tax=Georgenia alba TaxID=2233858 RepID=A0ABW2QBP4_9MICO